MDLVTVKNLTCFYKRNFFQSPVIVVKNISFKIKRGKTLVLMGASGKGKTTIAKVLWGLHNDYSGEIFFDGIENRRRDIQGVFQSPHDSLDPRQKVVDLLREAALIHNFPFDQSQGITSLQKVGLDPQFLSYYPYQLSGGECQRVVLARSLFLKSKLLILDEPTKSLDLINRKNILNLLKDIQKKEGTSYLFITHDEMAAEFIADEIIRL